MARKFKLERTQIDGNIKNMSGEALHVEFNKKQEKIDNTLEKGKDYVADKNKIEKAIEKIESSSMPSDDKKVQLMILNESLQELEDRYTEDIAKVIEKYEQESDAIVKMVEENIAAVEKQIAELKDVKLESGAVSIDKAVQAAEQKKFELSEYAKEELKNSQLRIDQKNMMDRDMRRKKFLEIGKK